MINNYLQFLHKHTHAISMEEQNDLFPWKGSSYDKKKLPIVFAWTHTWAISMEGVCVGGGGGGYGRTKWAPPLKRILLW
jgi:hypothetical protein